MITFTYRDGEPWQAQHMRTFWHRVRQWFRRNRVELRYTWTMELTKRGRPHYHALVWVPRHLMLPTPDKRGWWDQGMTRTEKARNAVGYLAKYASKLTDAEATGDMNPDGSVTWRKFPKGARISGGCLLRGDPGREWRYWCAPRWVRERVGTDGDIRRAKRGGGYVDLATGEWLQSPWRFLGPSPDGKWLLFEPRDEGSGSAAVTADPRTFSNDRSAMRC